jgi:hypothetical protein
VRVTLLSVVEAIQPVACPVVMIVPVELTGAEILTWTAPVPELW